MATKNREHFESLTHVTITFIANHVVPDASKVQIGKRTVAVSLHLETGGEAIWEVTLFGEVDPARSTFKYVPRGVEVKLAKATPGMHWGTLEAHALKEEIMMNMMPAFDASAFNKDTPALTDALAKMSLAPPPSARQKPWTNNKTDFDALEREIKEEEARDFTASQGRDMDSFQRYLYANGDDEKRRAMVKSFVSGDIYACTYSFNPIALQQQSNGTVLSTNWDEVSQHDYSRDIRPPEGMELKKW